MVVSPPTTFLTSSILLLSIRGAVFAEPVYITQIILAVVPIVVLFSGLLCLKSRLRVITSRILIFRLMFMGPWRRTWFAPWKMWARRCLRGPLGSSSSISFAVTSSHSLSVCVEDHQRTSGSTLRTLRSSWHRLFCSLSYVEL